MEALRGLVEHGTPGEAVATRTATGERVKIAKLTEQDDIEAYLTTFERTMQTAKVGEDTWAIRLAQQLTGKGQQAYAAMRDTDATNGSRMISSSGTIIIVKRPTASASEQQSWELGRHTRSWWYVRAAKLGVGEIYSELVVRLEDLMTKWTASCRTIQEIREKFTVEQLLKTMPTDLKSVGGRAEANHCSRGWTVSGRLSTGPANTSNIAEGQVETRRCHRCDLE